MPIDIHHLKMEFVIFRKQIRFERNPQTQEQGRQTTQYVGGVGTTYHVNKGATGVTIKGDTNGFQIIPTGDLHGNKGNTQSKG